MNIKVKTKFILLDYHKYKHNYLDSANGYLTGLPINLPTIIINKNYHFSYYKCDFEDPRRVYFICG